MLEIEDVESATKEKYEETLGSSLVAINHLNQVLLILLSFISQHQSEEGFVTKQEEKEKTQTHHQRSDYVLDISIHFLKLS